MLATEHLENASWGCGRQLDLQGEERSYPSPRKGEVGRCVGHRPTVVEPLFLNLK